MLPFLTQYPKPEDAGAENDNDNGSRGALQKLSLKPMLLTLLALFLFQVANMGPYAYIVGLGQQFGLEMAFISPTLGVAAWIGIVGAGLVVVFQPA